MGSYPLQAAVEQTDFLLQIYLSGLEPLDWMLRTESLEP